MFKKRLCALIITAIFTSFICTLSAAPTSLTDNLFVLQGNHVQSLTIDESFTENAETDVVLGIPVACDWNSAIYGASVDAKIKLLNEASLVRVILIDTYGDEYMIYEINSLLAEKTTFAIKDVCHETKLLNAVTPASIRVDLLAATIEVERVSFATTLPCLRSEMASLQSQIKSKQHLQRIDFYNKMIKMKGEEWVAGPTDISMATYEEKKCYYLGGVDNPLPNTQGTEFYADGIMAGRTNVPPEVTDLPKTSMYVDTFDWRNRHGATDPSSPYYNKATNGKYNGWCTPIENQKQCGSCYIFGSTADAEQKINLYYNQHLDHRLSEQYVGSCEYAGRMCNGGMPDRVTRWVGKEGILDEKSFPYTAKNSTPCRDSSNDPTDHVFFKETKTLKNKEIFNYEDFKKCLIKYGPIAGADLSISHAMCVVGYISPSPSNVTLIYKNSHGQNSGKHGYMYRKSPYSRSSWSTYVMSAGPESIKSRVYSDKDIRCVDLDKDGFYNWGIGKKPSTCPEGCPDEVDCDDSDPKLGPYEGETGKCKENVTGIAFTKASTTGIKYYYSYDPIQRITTIRFEAPGNAAASVQIYRLSGTLVTDLAINETENGFKQVVWNNTESASSKGIYVCKISVINAGITTASSFKIAVLK